MYFNKLHTYFLFNEVRKQTDIDLKTLFKQRWTQKSDDIKRRLHRVRTMKSLEGSSKDILWEIADLLRVK